VLLACLAFALAVAWPQPSRADNQCFKCHEELGKPALRDPAIQWRDGAHGHDDIGCHRCHGGDPGDASIRAHAEDTGFVAKPTRGQIVALCGGCHGDARFVRRFNARLPIDQLTLYQLSQHGSAHQRGNSAAPVCSDCHGTHDVAQVTSPKARVHRTRVTALCGGCHSKAERMGGAKLPHGQQAGFERSVHGAALARGDASAPTCAGCHGGHGELAASAANTGQLCGSCHRAQLRQVRESPHSKPFARLGLSDCVPCHGAHDVAPASTLLVGLGTAGACSKCHNEPSKALDASRALAERLEQVRAAARASRQRLARAQAEGKVVTDGARLQRELDVGLAALPTLVHGLDAQQLDAASEGVRSRALELDRAVENGEPRRRKGTGYGVVAVVAVLLGVWLAWWWRRRRWRRGGTR
jgi:hypothetical protein